MLTTVFIYGSASAQISVDYVRLADRAFADKEYYAAAQFYEKALGNVRYDTTGRVFPYRYKSSNDTKFMDDFATVIYRLAESHRLYFNYTAAEEWYLKAMAFENAGYPLSRFWYAYSLRANQKYELALDQYLTFRSNYRLQDEYRTIVTMEIERCAFAISELNFPRMYNVRRLPSDINKVGSNYASTWLGGDNFLFTSSRPQGIKSKNVDPYTNQIYIGNPYSLDNFKVLAINQPKDTDQGATSLSPDGNTLYFTRWLKRGSEKQYAIFRANKTGDTLSNPEQLNSSVNVDNFNSIHPFVTSDGKYLLYSSNRPGGVGKYDIWYCMINADGTLGTPINAGSSINTVEDEQSPVFDALNNRLIFSSNGLIGMGGFDLFESKGNIGQFAKPRNLGYPINSGQDDMYFTIASDNNSRFLISSDRDNVCCLELLDMEKLFVFIKGIVIDEETKLPLGSSKVVLIDSLTNRRLDSIITPINGNYMFELPAKVKYRLEYSKPGYFGQIKGFDSRNIDISTTINLREVYLTPFEINKPIVIKNILYDFDKADLRPESQIELDKLFTIMMDNPRIVVELSSHTDSVGSDVYNMNLSQARAQSCVDYLLSKGLNANKIVAKGYGKTRPVAPNSLPNGKDNPDGRQLNRRTEFTVTRID